MFSSLFSPKSVVPLLMFVLLFYNNASKAQTLVEISPDTVTQGDYVKISIHGSSTNFNAVSTSTDIFFQQSFNEIIYADTFNLINDSLMNVFFHIPYSYTGIFKLNIIATNTLSLDSALVVLNQSLINPEIVSIQPDSVYQGNIYSFKIFAKDCHFQNAKRIKIWLIHFYADHYVVINDTLMEVYKTIPFSVLPGLYGIEIENSIDGKIRKSNCIKVLKSLKSPKIASINPDSVSQGEEIKTLITGINTHFQTSNIQYIQLWNNSYFLNHNISKLQVINDTALYAWFYPLFSSPAGLYDLKVKTDSDYIMISPKSFKVVETPLKPRISSISPDSASQGEQLTMTIRGKNTHFTFLNKDPIVSLYMNKANIISVSSISVYNDSLAQVSFNIPQDATPGTYEIIVHDSMDGTMKLLNAFRVVQLPNKSEIILALPDTFQQGEYYKARIFCSNTKLSNTNSLHFRYVQETPSIHFDPNPDSIRIVNDTIIFGTIATNTYWNNPIGTYNLKVYEPSSFSYSLENAAEVIPSPKLPHILTIEPNKIERNDEYTISIYGNNTKFLLYSSVNVVLKHKIANTISPTNTIIVNDTLIESTFDIPINSFLGYYDLIISSSSIEDLSFPIEVVVPNNYPQVKEIAPSYCKRGENTKIIISTKNTVLSQFPESQRVFLVREDYSDTIYVNNYTVINDTTSVAFIHPSKTLIPGKYDVLHWGSSSGNLRFFKAFTVTRFSDSAKIESLYPDSIINVDSIELIVNCTKTTFTKDKIIYPIFQGKNGNELNLNSITIVDDTTLSIKMNIPDNYEDCIGITILTDQEGDFHYSKKLYIKNTVSIDEYHKPILTVYPNPFFDMLTIESNVDIQRIEIFDVSTRLLYSSKELGKYTTISDLKLEEGIYYLKLTIADQVFVKKILKY